MAFERLDRAELPIAHEGIAQLLGVRREGVTEAAGRLQASVQFGRLCREIFPESSWDECETHVRRHWEGIRAEATWDRVRDWVLQGWSHKPPPHAGGDT